jgi:hypothetical protein
MNYRSVDLGDVPEEDMTLQMCKEAVRQNGLQLEYVPEQWKQELSLAAVRDNGSALEYVPDKPLRFAWQLSTEMVGR